MTLSTFGAEPDDAFIRAQLACQRLVVQAARLADAFRAQDTMELCTPDCERVLNGTVSRGEAIRDFLARRDAMTDRITRHCLCNMHFEMQGQDRARMESTCLVYLLSHPDEAQRRLPETIIDFIDEFRRDADGVWRFSRREAVIRAGQRDAGPKR
jgi:hypothetical protein